MQGEATPNARAIRLSMGVRALALAVAWISLWELLAGGWMDPEPGRLLWLVPGIAGLEAWFSSRNLHPASGIPATRPASRADAGGSGRARVWLARFGFALAVVAGWSVLKALLELAWIDIRPMDPQVWPARLLLWTVLLLVGAALSRPWRADRACPAPEPIDRPGEER